MFLLMGETWHIQRRPGRNCRHSMAPHMYTYVHKNIYIQTLYVHVLQLNQGEFIQFHFNWKAHTNTHWEYLSTVFSLFFAMEQKLGPFELSEPLKVVRGLFRDCTELIMSFALSVFRSAGQLPRHHIFHLWNGPMFTQQFQLICGEEIEQIYALDKQTILDHITQQYYMSHVMPSSRNFQIGLTDLIMCAGCCVRALLYRDQDLIQQYDNL